MILIQARSTSTRFPNKAMALLQGHPLIRHVYDRCGVVYYGRMFVIPEGDPLKGYLRENFIPFYEGPAHDVLKRFHHAAKAHDLKWVMRVTGDCPMISPAQVAIVYQMGMANKADFITNCLVESADGHEVEFISFRLLERAAEKATEDSDREHVTTWIKRNWESLAKEGFVMGSYVEPLPIGPKMSVDTPEDLERVQELTQATLNRKNLYVQLGQQIGPGRVGKAGSGPGVASKGKRPRTKA